MKTLVLLLVIAFASNMMTAQEADRKELVKKGNAIEAVIYHDNGMIAQQGSYNSDGKPHGTWTSYDTAGNKTATAQYHNGSKTGTWYFYTDEELKEVSYQDNRIAKVVTRKDNETEVVSNR